MAHLFQSLLHSFGQASAQPWRAVTTNLSPITVPSQTVVPPNTVRKNNKYAFLLLLRWKKHFTKPGHVGIFFSRQFGVDDDTRTSLGVFAFSLVHFLSLTVSTTISRFWVVTGSLPSLLSCSTCLTAWWPGRPSWPASVHNTYGVLMFREWNFEMPNMGGKFYAKFCD